MIGHIIVSIRIMCIMLLLCSILAPYIDPYIKLYIEFEDQVMFKWKSSVKHNSLAPVYNECFSYTLPKEMSMALNNITVSVFVIDVHHLSPNEAMGVVTIGENANCLSGRKHWAEVIQSDQLISFWHPIQLPKKHYMRYRSPSPLPRWLYNYIIAFIINVSRTCLASTQRNWLLASHVAICLCHC